MNIFSNPHVRRIAKVAHTEQEPLTQRVPPLQRTDAPARSDSVNLSSEAKMLNAVRRELAQIPDIRTEKVQALKKAIGDGTYHVPAEKIAEAMIREGKIPED